MSKLSRQSLHYSVSHIKSVIYVLALRAWTSWLNENHILQCFKLFTNAFNLLPRLHVMSYGPFPEHIPNLYKGIFN